MYTVSNYFKLFLLLFCVKITNNLRSPGYDFDVLKSNKLNDCSRCKLLTDSFDHWLGVTSRGKYEGGDAAWEASKLKSYSRSEVRLVEIQEGLCSELNKHQDDCYILSEEVDLILEKWWFHEDPSSIDLHTWLCIETLKYCCPAYHFGDTCTPCPLDKDNKICSGHGKCDGDGTRKGNGTCLCKGGYSGKHCEECSLNFYSASDGSCVQCHQACSGCSGEGPGSCYSCRSGWQMESGTCTDIDECFLPSTCNTNQYCVNEGGSFKCKSCDSSCKTCVGAGANNCTACEHSNILWNGMCITKQQQGGIIYNTIKRLGLYLGLLAILLIIFRTLKHLAGIAIVIIGVFICYYETASSVHILDVIYNVYKTSRQ